MVVNINSGKIDVAQAYDTSRSSKELDNFIDNEVTKIPNGSFILIACKSDCVAKLSAKAKKWLWTLGSKYIEKLMPR